ncbi:MAG: DNA polymerase III subunit alpha [Micromonosporaceae bacterium]|nr:DNA polymerase III subunit alpha [Micromonosporaceae bacterium]
MGWDNPPIPWPELERRLSGRPSETTRESPGEQRVVSEGRLPPLVEDPLAVADEYPASRRRPAYRALEARPRRHVGAVPYAELHCHSNFSFLDGASHPEELAQEAARLGLSALAITDHDGLYGVVRFSEAAKFYGVPTIFGAELSLGLSGPQNGVPDPEGGHLLVLARNPAGYASLSRAVSEGQLAGGQKGKPAYQMERLAELATGNWLILTGCRKGLVPAALTSAGAASAGAATGAGVTSGGVAAAARELDRLRALFGAENVAVELIDHGQPLDDERNAALAALAERFGLPAVATNNVHYDTPGRRRLAAALAAVRARRSLDEIDGWLPAAATAHLRSGEEMRARFAAYPGAVERTAEFADECAFDLDLVAPNLPDCPVPAGHTEMSWLRELTRRGALDRYGAPERNPEAHWQIAHELDIIEKLGYPGYFLIVRGIVEFCLRKKILCQGRGSAANSAVCYALRITNVDAVEHGLLFERFLAPEREGPPDIDLDIESDRREEVIQHVYGTYGRHNAAQVANVISYRPRSAVRDIAKAFGYSPGQQDAWSKQIDRWDSAAQAELDEIPEPVIAYANELQRFPRHLGIHSGGMVLCDRPVIDVCPVEWARMPNRTVLQWDKDDCAAAGLVKFDLLGLGMLSALRNVIDLIADYHGDEIDLAKLPQEDPEVYRMLCRADSVGVFQVESRAQMATLPRLKPKKFYDLVVEVALIRPGPIQGGSVHPYIRRANGLEKPDPPHPLMEKALGRTLGVPLFQEQLMQMAIDVAGFDAAGADQLRRAMGSKRSEERMAELKGKLYAGMAEKGITGALADDVYLKLSSFANFGFPESHAYSFAYLVYASSWFKLYYPAAFCAALLNAQPMGFYSPNTLVADARRHGVETRRPDINASDAKACLEPVEQALGSPAAHGEGRRHPGRDGDPRDPGDCGEASPPAVRLGLASVRQISDKLAERIESERADGGAYRDMADLGRRVGLTAAQMEALATADAFGCFGLTRREALWLAGAAAAERPDRLSGTSEIRCAPTLPGMDAIEQAAADVWATGLSPDSHPAEFAREVLDAAGAVPIAGLGEVTPGVWVKVGGVVTHRQRPGTAGGVTFLNLEDETGMLNVICQQRVWQRYRKVARTSPALVIRGKLERAEGVTNLLAERIEPLTLPVRSTSRDFR